jgi:hypothetical protein
MMAMLRICIALKYSDAAESQTTELVATSV